MRCRCYSAAGAFSHLSNYLEIGSRVSTVSVSVFPARERAISDVQLGGHSENVIAQRQGNWCRANCISEAVGFRLRREFGVLLVYGPSAYYQFSRTRTDKFLKLRG